MKKSPFWRWGPFECNLQLVCVRVSHWEDVTRQIGKRDTDRIKDEVLDTFSIGVTSMCWLWLMCAFNWSHFRDQNYIWNYHFVNSFRLLWGKWSFRCHRCRRRRQCGCTLRRQLDIGHALATDLPHVINSQKEHFSILNIHFFFLFIVRFVWFDSWRGRKGGRLKRWKKTVAAYLFPLKFYFLLLITQCIMQMQGVNTVARR